MAGKLIGYLFGHPQKFLYQLVAAELNACTEFDCNFINSMREQYETYQGRMRITPKQKTILLRIAGEDEEVTK